MVLGENTHRNTQNFSAAAELPFSDRKLVIIVECAALGQRCKLRRRSVGEDTSTATVLSQRVEPEVDAGQQGVRCLHVSICQDVGVVPVKGSTRAGLVPRLPSLRLQHLS